MTDTINKSKTITDDMGATSNNSSRISALQERKKQIEELLTKRNQELREICLQEAEITGTLPSEMPLEIGETPPTIRRRLVGTTFQLPENLVQNTGNKDEMIQGLELQIQLHANLAEAALGLANEQNVSKTIKRQHRSEYQKHKNHCLALQEKLAHLKEKQSAEQPKHRKKPRTVEVTKPLPPDTLPHNSFSNNNNNDPLFNADIRHSLRYMKSSEPVPQNVEQYRYPPDYRRYRPTSELPFVTQQRYDDIFSGIYSLSLNGYSRYLERRENFNNVSPSYNTNMYQYNSNHDQYHQTNPYYPTHYNSTQHSPQLSQHGKSFNPTMQSLYLSQRSPQHQSPQQSRYSDYPAQYNYINGSPQKGHHYIHSLHSHVDYKHYPSDNLPMNPHQIQPHQQYEHTNVTTSGLGGCWRKNERGELVWSSISDQSWQRDKRFGSLDRRRNKRVTKVSMDNKSATLGGSSDHQVLNNNVSINPAQVIRRSVDRQLVRTQSLGSVGAQTLDSVYPSDDNSSCGSENRNRSNSHTLQKIKKKEWVETALDSPVLSTKQQHSPSFKPLPLPPSALAPEEKYFMNSNLPVANHTPPPPILSPKPPIEIPAESNPSPRLSETNSEFFNSPVNKQNFTVVQEGQCKPYHEETKPFEMSDFYKYSTKYKKIVKQDTNSDPGSLKGFDKAQEQNVNQTYSPKRFYGSPTNISTLDNSRGFNANFEALNPHHLQTEVNRWYEEHHLNNTDNRSEGRYTNTLV